MFERRFRYILCLLGLLSISSSVATSSAAQTIEPLPGIRFTPPVGFTRLSQDELVQKYGRVNAPQMAFGDPTRSASVALAKMQSSTNTQRIYTNSALEEVNADLARSLNQIRGIKWLSQGFATLAKQRWVHLEFLTPANEFTIYNDMYVTAHRGNLVMFTFNVTENLRKKLEPALRASRDSIQLVP